MKLRNNLFSLVAAVTLGLVAGCAGHHQAVSVEHSGALGTEETSRPQSTNTVSKRPSSGGPQLSPEQAKELAAKVALAEQEDKEIERRLAMHLPPPPSEWPFPNPELGLPLRVSFYGIDDSFPDYLLCEYDVEEKPYYPSKEAEWFTAALRQTRRWGPRKFPPLKWVAVIIVNRGEWKGESTFEQCHKVGAIFSAREVFNCWRSLSRLVARAEFDRHPYVYDKSQPTPGEQDRWVMVERHAATNHASADPSRP